MALDSLKVGSGGQNRNGFESLAALPAHTQTEANLTSHLASLYHAGHATTQLSSHGLVSFNTYTSSARGPDGGEAGSAMAATKELASRAWARLGHRGENQAVVFLGESGSGKTTLRSHLLSSFLSFSSTPLSSKLSYAAYIFDSLTTTKSANTPTASKAGLFLELQYDTTSSIHPTLIGGKLLDHRLERSRISSIPPGQRNFHILYYLLAGTSTSEKSHLGLDSPGGHGGEGGKRWRYLGHPSQLKVGLNDKESFVQFKTALRKLEFPRQDIAEICQILAAVLHIGQLEFVDTQSTAAAEGGSGHEGGEAVTLVKNHDTLLTIASFLGVDPESLQQSFAYKTKTLHKERVTVMLDSKGARAHADELAKTLYALLVAYIMESINSKTCAVEESIANTISIVDFPGFAPQSSPGQVLDQLLNNAAAENLYHICLQNFFERQGDMLDTEEVAVPATSYFDNSDAVKGLLKPGNGLLGILDDQARKGRSDHAFLDSLRKRFEGKNPSITAGSSTSVFPGNNFATPNPAASFSVKHFAGEVDYPVEGLIEANSEAISGDIMALFHSSQSEFVARLFGQEAVSTVSHPKMTSTIIQGQILSKPTRMPSMSRKKFDRMQRFAKRGSQDDDSVEGDSRPSTAAARGKAESQQGVAGQFLTSLQNITKTLSSHGTNSYFVFCLRPNDRRIANSFDSKAVRLQIQVFGIPDISQRLRNADFSVFMPFAEFLGLTEVESALIGTEREKCESILDEKHWPGNEARVGSTGVFLSERCWLEIANISSLPAPSSGSRFIGAGGESGEENLTPGYADSRLNLISKSPPYTDDKAGAYFSEQDIDTKSDAGVSAFNSNMFGNMETRQEMAEKATEKKAEVVEEHKVSGSRKRWMFFVWLLTFWLPTPLIGLITRSKRKEVKVSWREKLAINMLIWLSCSFVIFFMIGFPELICPRQDVFSFQELSAYDGKSNHQAYVAIRGVVYDLSKFSPHHYPGQDIISNTQMLKYAGKDATNIFPVQVSALCNGKDGEVDPSVLLDYKSTNYTNTNVAVSSTDPIAQYHDFRWFTNDSRPDWWWEQQYMLKANYQKGRIGYTPQYVSTLAGKSYTIAIINKRVYDMTTYIAGGRQTNYPAGGGADGNAVDVNFMDELVVQLFQQTSGSDATKYWDTIQMSAAEKQRMQVCLDNLFYVGDVDTRSSAQCLFAKYLLLAISILLASVLCFKFLAALQFGRKNLPENLDKFVICQVPAYTEDEDSLRRAIDSIARMKYDDKRKLLVVICDGMIIGQGNDRPTPRIVLDILGVEESYEAKELSFESLGEGQKQHNMGKVYSGLYETMGHIVPFLVVVKVGKPSEVQK
jgi:chitin synthase